MQAAQAGLAALSISRLRHRFASGREVDLRVSMELGAGQSALVTGPSGSGKSTLLRAIANCLPEGGETFWEADFLPARVLLALAEPDPQLLCSTVDEEIAFGLTNHGIRGAEAESRVLETLDLVGIPHLRTRSVEALSAGEKYRVVLAALVALRPRVLLLDEPYSQLDASGRLMFGKLVARLKSEGRSVIATAHEASDQPDLWDVRLALDNRECCRVHPEGPPAFLLDSPRAATTHIAGDNGAGKTTLLRKLAGQGSQRRRVGFMPQDIGLMLFEASVEREVGFALRRAKLAPDGLRAGIARVLSFCGLTLLADEPPLCLSHGERQMVALASVLAGQPDMLLLDEPLAGLDRVLAMHVLDLLDHAAHHQGTAVVLASHGPLPRPWGDRMLVLEEGRLYARQ